MNRCSKLVINCLSHKKRSGFTLRTITCLLQKRVGLRHAFEEQENAGANSRIMSNGIRSSLRNYSLFCSFIFNLMTRKDPSYHPFSYIYFSDGQWHTKSFDENGCRVNNTGYSDVSFGPKDPFFFQVKLEEGFLSVREVCFLYHAHVGSPVWLTTLLLSIQDARESKDYREETPCRLGLHVHMHMDRHFSKLTPLADILEPRARQRAQLLLRFAQYHAPVSGWRGHFRRRRVRRRLVAPLARARCHLRSRRRHQKETRSSSWHQRFRQGEPLLPLTISHHPEFWRTLSHASKRLPDQVTSIGHVGQHHHHRYWLHRTRY